MIDDMDSDPVDDLLLPLVTTTDRPLGKFQPKARTKPVKVATATRRTCDAIKIAPTSVESAAPYSDSNLELEQAYLRPSISNFSNVACELEHQYKKESGNQQRVILTESVALKGESMENSVQNQENLDQDSDLCFSSNSCNGPVTITGSSDGYQPKENPQSENKELLTSPNIVPEIEPEAMISPEASEGGLCFQGSDVDIQPDLAKSQQVLTEHSCEESPTDLLHPIGTTGIQETAEETNHETALSESSFLFSELNTTKKSLHVEKELLASESTDGGQVSFTNAARGPLLDDPQQLEMEVPCGLESIDDLTFQHSTQTNVRQVVKFQPRKKKLCQKKMTLWL